MTVRKEREAERRTILGLDSGQHYHQGAVEMRGHLVFVVGIGPDDKPTIA